MVGTGIALLTWLLCSVDASPLRCARSLKLAAVFEPIVASPCVGSVTDTRRRMLLLGLRPLDSPALVPAPLWSDDGRADRAPHAAPHTRSLTQRCVCSASLLLSQTHSSATHRRTTAQRYSYSSAPSISPARRCHRVPTAVAVAEMRATPMCSSIVIAARPLIHRRNTRRHLRANTPACLMAALPHSMHPQPHPKLKPKRGHRNILQHPPHPTVTIQRTQRGHRSMRHPRHLRTTRRAGPSNSTCRESTSSNSHPSTRHRLSPRSSITRLQRRPPPLRAILPPPPRRCCLLLPPLCPSIPYACSNGCSTRSTPLLPGARG